MASHRRVKVCSFLGCSSDSKNNKDVRFFNFPKKNISEWVRACNNAKLENLSENNLNSHYFVCSKHFVAEQYTKIMSPFKTRLLPWSIPKHFGSRLRGKWWINNVINILSGKCGFYPGSVLGGRLEWWFCDPSPMWLEKKEGSWMFFTFCSSNFNADIGINYTTHKHIVGPRFHSFAVCSCRVWQVRWRYWRLFSTQK